ncbi:MAG: adenylate/guanylate cyclase domain-containing protein, partial [Armatimonadetes bacterium]|nr:adenylate/guanylate cyclase domain-containing protein [Armatimonadota bacterium]
MPRVPTGTVTFLFTDIEGSTRLLHHLGDTRYAQVLADHRRLLRAAFAAGGGDEIETQGDGFLVAFQSARDAILTTVAAQRAVGSHPWPEGAAVRVRMGLHTTEAASTGEVQYAGLGIHRAARICSVGWGGQILLSRITAGLIESDLPEGAGLRDLGEHRLKDLQRPEQIYQLFHPDLPADFPPLRSMTTFTTNLPIQLTSFIGREHEIDELTRALRTARLLTLTGSGGVGKTRLALQVAAEMLEEFLGGVWLVELAGLSDPSFVPQAVASTLGAREKPGRPPAETLVEHLASSSVLLLLDNCEHVLSACGHLADRLLRRCPNVRIMATSQQGLGISGEFTYRVPSLASPDLQRVPSVEDLARYEAVRLFVERAVYRQPRFQLTDRNASAVAQVCHRLDGIPLAIELAVARLNGLSVEQIATRLDDRFRLLTGGSRTALPRQQTLKGAIDWSYSLLSEKEQALLRRLSVFAGGCSLETAEAVCAGAGIDTDEILDLLTGLVEKSLVVAERRESEHRYRLLETVRRYGLDRLREAGEVADVHRRHLAWFLALAE